jgi:hypothetical protein
MPGMIRFQIIERTGANLHKTLVDAMRTGELRTFEATRRGRRIQHKNLSYPGWMNWSVAGGIINCEVISPRKPGREWQLFSAFLGRLADRYADRIVAINVQFPDSTSRTGRTAGTKNIGDQRGASDSAWRQARKGEAQGERSRIDDVDGFSKGDPNFEKEK